MPKFGEFFSKARRILRYFKPYWPRWLVLFLLANISTGLALVHPLFLKFFIDGVLVGKNFTLLNTLIGLFFLVFIVGAVFSIVTSYYYTKLKLALLFDVRNELFHHLEYTDVAFFQEKKLGDILSRLTTDVAAIEAFISLIFNTFIINTLMLIFIFAISSFLHFKLTLLAATVVPFIVLAQKYYGGVIREKYRGIRQKGAEFLSYLQERLSIVPLIKLFTQEENELKREKNKAKEVISMDLDLTLTSGFASLATATLTSAAMLFVMWYGGYQVMIGALSIGSVVAIYNYIIKLFGPVGTLTGLNVALQTTMVSADRVFEFLDIKPKVDEKPGAKSIGHLQGEICFEDVYFDYEGKPVLENISFTIKPGESIGLVGPSGVGKTTLVQLIARFIDPISGAVKIDGQDLRDVRIRSLRRQIGMVTQDVVLFNATIRENIAYGKPRAGYNEIADAARIAGIHDFIITLPKSYETELGERGLKLSQGQRQRISLARVILRNPRIFLLDEATAFLDSESEARIQKAIDQAMEGRTSIIIAHRLATIQAVDRIFVLSDRELVEVGTFTGLMDKKGPFYELYMAQFGGFHVFQKKLDYEMERAREFGEVLLLFEVLVTNYPEIIRQKGREKGAEMMEETARIICDNIRQIDFMSRDPHRQNLFHIVMPKIGPFDGEKLKKLLGSKISPECSLKFVQTVSDIHGSNVEEMMRHGENILARYC